MKQLLVFTFLLALSFSQQGQELVQNGGFEDISDCPSELSSSGYFSYISGSDTLHDFMKLAAPWYCPTSGTSDLFNSCATSLVTDVPSNTFGTAEAFEGEGYACLICYHNIADDWENSPPLYDYTEYIQAPLAEPLIPDATYKASFKVRRASSSRFAIDQLGLAVHQGILVADDSIYAGRLEVNPVLLTPPSQVITSSSEWQLFEAEFIPSAPVDHVMVGRFEKFVDLEIEEMTNEVLSVILRRAVYYFDDISIELISIPSHVESAEMPLLEVRYAQGRLFFTSPEAVLGSFLVHDAVGKVVYQGRLHSNTESIELNLSNGIYFVQGAWGVRRFSAF